MHWGKTLGQRRMIAMARVIAWGEWRRRFAWWPTRMSDQSWVWLEAYGTRVTPDSVKVTMIWLEHTDFPSAAYRVVEWETRSADLLAMWGVSLKKE